MHNKGFTLLEVIISVMIFVVAILMATGSLVVAQSIREKVEKMRLVQEESRSLAEFLGREIEGAQPTGIDVSNNGSSLTITKIDIETEELISETIMPSVDSQYMVMVVEKGGSKTFQNVNSERTVLTKLQFSPVDTRLSYVNVEFGLEEASPSKASQGIGKRVALLRSILGRPAAMEMHFTAIVKASE